MSRTLIRKCFIFLLPDTCADGGKAECQVCSDTAARTLSEPAEIFFSKLWEILLVTSSNQIVLDTWIHKLASNVVRSERSNCSLHFTDLTIFFTETFLINWDKAGHYWTKECLENFSFRAITFSQFLDDFWSFLQYKLVMMWRNLSQRKIIRFGWKK